MKRRPDLNQKDWELCCLYLRELKGQEISVHEPWERELEAWAADPGRYPRRSTVVKLRMRFPDIAQSTE